MIQNVQKWYRKMAKCGQKQAKNEKLWFFRILWRISYRQLNITKIVKIVKNRSKYRQKVVANGQANAHFFNWKCEYTYNAPKYGLQTLFTVICPYKIGLISKIKSNFVIFDPFWPMLQRQKQLPIGEYRPNIAVGRLNTLTMNPNMVYKHFLLTYALIKVV